MLLIIHTLRVDRLVERRTAELQASIAERDALEKANQANAQMLAQMERAGIVAQLSSMVAHELRQPLMSIMNFVGGLSLYMRKLIRPIRLLPRPPTLLSKKQNAPQRS